MEAWVRLNATDAGGIYYHPIFAQGGHSGDSDQVFGIYAGPPNPLRLWFYRGSAWGARIELIGPEVISRQQWAHCALDYDGVTIRGYLNGVLQFSQVSASGWIATPNPFRVGRGTWSSTMRGTDKAFRGALVRCVSPLVLATQQASRPQSSGFPRRIVGGLCMSRRPCVQMRHL